MSETVELLNWYELKEEDQQDEDNPQDDTYFYYGQICYRLGEFMRTKGDSIFDGTMGICNTAALGINLLGDDEAIVTLLT